MRIKNIHQQGFGAVAILAIVLALCVVVLAGLYVKRNSDNKNKNTTSNTQQSKDSSQTDLKDVPVNKLSKNDIVSASAEKIKFSALPEEAQEAAKAKITEVAPACIKNEQLLAYDGTPIDPEVSFAEVGSFIMTVGCDSGAATLFAQNKEGAWAFVSSTQMGFKCDDIFNNPVPKKLMEIATPSTECYETSTGKTVPFDEALGARYR